MGFFFDNNWLSQKEYVKKTIKMIDKKCPKCYIHLSNKKISVDSIKNYSIHEKSWLSTPIYYNPRGLWFSYGSAWLKFIEEHDMYDSSWAKAKYVYKILLGEKVHQIHNVDELIEFHKRFAKYKKDSGYIIDWNNVKKKYNGLIINPYLGYKIWGKDRKVLHYYLEKENNEHIRIALGKDIQKYPKLYLEWYRHWETASGVIWRKDGVEDIIDISPKERKVSKN